MGYTEKNPAAGACGTAGTDNLWRGWSMQQWMRIGTAALALWIAGCHGSGVVQDAAADRSLVYAYFDLSEANVPLGWARLKQVLPVVERPYFRMRYRRDAENKFGALVWYEDVAPGSYQMTEFGGEKKAWGGRAKVTLQLGDSGSNQTAIRIDQPGIYFLGAYRYKVVGRERSRGWPFTVRTTFELVPLESPGPRDLLKRLLEAAEGSSWEPRIRQVLQGGAI